MNILFVSGLDIGGWGWRVSKAINKYTKWKAKNLVMQQTYLNYPCDHLYPEMSREEVKDLLEWADFYILRWIDQDHMFNKLKLQNYLRPDNFLIKLHGSEARSGIWLYWFNPLLEWNPMILTSFDYTIARVAGFSCQHIPHLIDFDELPKPDKPDPPPIRIAHSPTDPKKKNTQLFLKAVENLKNMGIKDIEPVIIVGKPYKECLEIKAKCHVTFDQIGYQLQKTFGMSSIEAWALRQPSIVELDYWTLSRWPKLEEIVYLANQNNLEEVLCRMTKNVDMIKYRGFRAYQFAKENFDARKVIWQWINLIKFVSSRRR